MGISGSKKLISTTLALIFVASAGFAACAEDTLRLRGDFGEAQFSVSVADTNAERAQGLMFVEEMSLMQGMLFVYDRPQRVSFWMRNTLIPLDMVFIDESGVVRNIHTMAQPLDETSIFGGNSIQFVLEINGGMADRLGLEAGDQIQHPSVGANSIWQCPTN